MSARAHGVAYWVSRSRLGNIDKPVRDVADNRLGLKLWRTVFWGMSLLSVLVFYLIEHKFYRFSGDQDVVTYLISWLLAGAVLVKIGVELAESEACGDSHADLQLVRKTESEVTNLIIGMKRNQLLRLGLSLLGMFVLLAASIIMPEWLKEKQLVALPVLMFIGSLPLLKPIWRIWQVTSSYDQRIEIRVER